MERGCVQVHVLRHARAIEFARSHRISCIQAHVFPHARAKELARSHCVHVFKLVCCHAPEPKIFAHSHRVGCIQKIMCWPHPRANDSRVHAAFDVRVFKFMCWPHARANEFACSHCVVAPGATVLVVSRFAMGQACFFLFSVFLVFSFFLSQVFFCLPAD